MAAPTETRASPSWPHRLRSALPEGTIRSFLELLALCGVAIAQPVLNTFGKGAELFVARGARRLDVIAFALIVGFLPPLLLTAAEVLVGLINRRLGRYLHLAFVFYLVAVIALQVAKRSIDQGWKVLGLVAVVAGAAGVAAVVRFAVVRTFLRYLAFGPIAFVLLFLLSSPVTPLVTNSGERAAKAVDVGRPAPVVLIVLDELPTSSLLGPDDQIDAELFPNLAGLAEDATFYRNHTTVAPDTTDAVPGLLTGKYPKPGKQRLPVVDEYPDNLFTLLGDGYRLNVSEGWTQLCPRNLCSELAGGARDAALPGLVGDSIELYRRFASPRARESDQTLSLEGDIFRYRTRQFRTFASSLSGPTEPRLDFLHVVLPHHGFSFLPNGQQYVAPPVPNGFVGDKLAGPWVDDEVAAAARQRHLLQTQHTDRLLGEVFDRLRELDRYDESLIVVTADHGASFLADSPFRGPVDDNVQNIMWTPLLLKAPDQAAGAVDDRPFRSIDVLPTVAELLEVDIPWTVDGRADGLGGSGDQPLRLRRWGITSLSTAEREGYFPVDGEEGFATMLEGEPVPAGPDPDLRIHRLGPYGELVGTSVDDVEQGESVSMDGRFFQEEALEDVDLDGRFLPAYLSGVFDTTENGPLRVAVAVNGRVAGVSNSYHLPNPLRWLFKEVPKPVDRSWWTMIPPAFLEDGENEVELFLVDGEPDEVRLRPLRLRD